MQCYLYSSPSSSYFPSLSLSSYVSSASNAHLFRPRRSLQEEFNPIYYHIRGTFFPFSSSTTVRPHLPPQFLSSYVHAHSSSSSSTSISLDLFIIVFILPLVLSPSTTNRSHLPSPSSSSYALAHSSSSSSLFPPVISSGVGVSL